MLDITSYRRKQKYVQPLTVMREFYHDNRAATLTKHRLKSCNDVDPLARQTLSIDKFSKCIQQMRNTKDNVSDNMSTLESTAPKQKQTLKQCHSLRKQPGCFKSSFSSSIALFNCHPAIKDRKCSDKDAVQKQNAPKPQICNIMFSKGKQHISKATQAFYEMCESKQQMIKIKKLKKERLNKIRSNWIIANLYKDTDTEVVRTAKNKYRIRQIFASTQQNIFPRA